MSTKHTHPKAATPIGVALPLVLLPLAKLIVHLATATRYGWFRDELYYLACAKRLAWGYVDQPPLSLVVLRAWTVLFGDSMLAVRLLAALVAAAAVLVTGLTARALGGGPFATALAMLGVLVAPEYLGADSIYSMNVFDLLFWTLAAWLLVLILYRGRERLWPVLGVVLGLGLLNKISVLWLGTGLAVGILLSPERRRVATPGPWIAAGIAAALFLPHLVWQMQHDWPTLEFIRNATGDKMRSIAPWSFLMAQILNQQPAAAPIWLAGLGFCLLAADGRRVRCLGVAYLVVFLLLVVNGKSRTGYLRPAYPMLLACGAVWIEQWTSRRGRWSRPVVLAIPLLAGAITAPLALRILPPEGYVRYAARLGIEPSTEENKELAELPQFFADHFGWPRLVAHVDRVYRALPAEDRARATIFASNYGEAGAIEKLGASLGLPRPISGHNNYWMWGPGPERAPVVLVVTGGGALARLRELFETAEDTGAIGCRYCMPYERDAHVYVCRGPHRDYSERWSDIKHFD